jgi:hypothetical protein
MSETPIDTAAEREAFRNTFGDAWIRIEPNAVRYLDEIDRINKENAALRALLDFIKDSPLFSEES